MTSVFRKYLAAAFTSVLPAALLLLPLSAFAQAPALTAVSGPALKNQPLIISGSNFGSKLPAQPDTWDNFEGGQANTQINGAFPVIGSSWQDWVPAQCRTCCAPTYSSGRLRPGSLLSDAHYYPHYFGETPHCSSIALQRWLTASEYYFTFWMYYDKLTPAYSGNFKPWDMYGSSNDAPTSYAGVGDPLFGDGGLRSASQDYPQPAQPTIWGNRGITDMVGKWVRMETYLKQSSPNVADGAYQVWLHTGSAGDVTTPTMSDTTFMSRTTSNFWRQLMFGWYNHCRRLANGSCDPAEEAEHTARIYFDDIYLDTTRARVEICDAATRASSTRCEIQIPTGWSASEITVQVNQGAFPAGSAAFLYVINAQGNSNSSGLQITFGAAGDTTAPSSPSNLRTGE